MTGRKLLVAAIACEIVATLALKGALQRPTLYLVVLAGYGASFGLFGEVLKRGVPLGVAYGIWGALGVAATSVLSNVFYGEALTVRLGLGMSLIILGIVTLELGSYLGSGRADRLPGGSDHPEPH